MQKERSFLYLYFEVIQCGLCISAWRILKIYTPKYIVSCSLVYNMQNTTPHKHTRSPSTLTSEKSDDKKIKKFFCNCKRSYVFPRMENIHQASKWRYRWLRVRLKLCKHMAAGYSTHESQDQNGDIKPILMSFCEGNMHFRLQCTQIYYYLGFVSWHIGILRYRYGYCTMLLFTISWLTMSCIIKPVSSDLI